MQQLAHLLPYIRRSHLMPAGPKKPSATAKEGFSSWGSGDGWKLEREAVVGAWGQLLLSQVLRPTSYGKWVGRPMYLKRGNFSFQARTAQNQLRMGKYGTYLEFNRSQEAPKHCPTFDSLTQSCAIAHFRQPPGSPQVAPNLIATAFPSLISFRQ